jgi:hypothetical protein
MIHSPESMRVDPKHSHSIAEMMRRSWWGFVAHLLLAAGVAPHQGTAFVPGLTRGEHGTRLAATPDDALVTSRRTFLGVGGLAGVVLTSLPQESGAADRRLFDDNPLWTNRVLEQIRIWEQEEANMVQYGGELARGDAGNQGKVSAYPSLLVPILDLEQQVQEMQRTLQQRENYASVLALLQQPQYETVALKRTFNDFADNIYYSDPDRANLYLGGGGTWFLSPCCCANSQ